MKSPFHCNYWGNALNLFSSWCFILATCGIVDDDECYLTEMGTGVCLLSTCCFYTLCAHYMLETQWGRSFLALWGQFPVVCLNLHYCVCSKAGSESIKALKCKASVAVLSERWDQSLLNYFQDALFPLFSFRHTKKGNFCYILRLIFLLNAFITTLPPNHYPGVLGVGQSRAVTPSSVCPFPLTTALVCFPAVTCCLDVVLHAKLLTNLPRDSPSSFSICFYFLDSAL